MESIVAAIKSSDPKEKLAGAQQLADIIHLPSQLRDLQNDVRLQLYNSMIVMIKEVNPRISQLGLDCLIFITNNNFEGFSCMCNMSFAAVLAKLADTKQSMRDKASEALVALVRFVGLQSGIERVLSLATSKIVHIRTACLEVVKMLCTAFEGAIASCPHLIAKLSPLLQDSQTPVKQLAIEVFCRLYSYFGSALISELESLAIKPAHVKSLTDAIKESGLSLDISKLVVRSAPSSTKVSNSASATSRPTSATSSEISRRGTAADRGLGSTVSTVQFGTTKPQLSGERANESTRCVGDHSATVAVKPVDSADDIGESSSASHLNSTLNSKLEPFTSDYIMSLITEKQSYNRDTATGNSRSGQAIQEFFTRLNQLLQNKDEWQLRVSALSSLQSALLFNQNWLNDPSLRTKLIACIRTSQDCIGSQITDLRSAVSKDACRTAALIAIQLGPDSAPFVEYMLPLLLKQITLKVQVMARAADKAIRIMIASSVGGYSRALLTILHDGCQSRSPSVRKYCIECLALSVVAWRVEVLERNLDFYKYIVKSRIDDGDQSTRKAARLLYVLLYDHQQLRLSMKSFMESEIDQSYQKLIFTDLLSPPTMLLEARDLLNICQNAKRHFTKDALDVYLAKLVETNNIDPSSKAANSSGGEAGSSLTSEVDNVSLVKAGRNQNLGGGGGDVDVTRGSKSLSDPTEAIYGDIALDEEGDLNDDIEYNDNIENCDINDIIGGHKDANDLNKAINHETYDDNKAEPNIQPPIRAALLSSDDFKAMSVDPLWSVRAKGLEIILERLLLSRSAASSRTGATREATEKDNEGLYLDLFIDISIDLLGDSHHKVTHEALKVVRILVLHFNSHSHMLQKLTVLFMALFQRITDRHSHIKDNSNDLLESIRVTFEPKALISSLYSTLIDIPDRARPFVIQYLNVIVPHCDSYFNNSQQSYFFLSRLGTILADSHKPSNSLLESGKRLVELIYRVAPMTTCSQLAILPLEPQSTLKSVLRSCVPDIETLISRAKLEGDSHSNAYDDSASPAAAGLKSNSSVRPLTRHQILPNSGYNKTNDIGDSHTRDINSSNIGNNINNNCMANSASFKTSEPMANQASQASNRGVDPRDRLVVDTTSPSPPKRAPSSAERAPAKALDSAAILKPNFDKPRDILWLLDAFKMSSPLQLKQEALQELRKLAKQERYDFWHKNVPQIVCILVESFQAELPKASLQYPNLSPAVDSQSKPPILTVYQNMLPYDASSSNNSYFDHMTVVIQALMILIKYQPHFVQVFLDILITRVLQAAAFLSSELTLMCERLLAELIPSQPLKCASLIMPFTIAPPERPADEPAATAALNFDSGTNTETPRSIANIQILALRLLQLAIGRLTSPQLLSIANALVVNIIPGLSHPLADIRKSALFVLIESYFVVGDVLYPYLIDLTLAQRKLLTVYIEKQRQEREKRK